MANADDYAKWIIANQDKKGSKDFDVVARAYEEAKASESKPKPETTSRASQVVDVIKNIPTVGTADAALGLATGMAAGPIAGLAGLLQGAKNITGDQGMSAGDRVHQVQNALTWQPKTELGQGITKVVSYPFVKLAELGDWAGRNTAEQIDSPGLVSPTGVGPVMGAAVNTAIQSAPLILGAKLGKQRAMTQAAEADAAETAATAAAAARAQNAVKAAGIDWAKVPGDIRGRIVDIAKDATAFNAMTPEQIGRMTKAQTLPEPVKLTKGQAARDPVQLRAEENLAQTTEGRPILEAQMDQNAALLKNLDILKGRTGGRAKDVGEVGSRVAGEQGALTMMRDRSLQNVDKLYNAARKAGELEGEWGIQPLVEYLNANPGKNPYAVSQLKDMRLVKEVDGVLQPTERITINRLEDLRKRATTVARTSADGTTRYDAGQLVGQIDAMLPETAAGEAYKAARAARREHAMQFEEPQAISRLLDEKSRTDRLVALEDVWGTTVLKGSVADLNKVKNTLLNSNDPQALAMGQKAWKDIAGQTVQYIKDQATKSAALDARGNPNISPAALKATLDRIGDKKLELVFGKDGAQMLRDISSTTADVKTLPPQKAGSTTVPNLLSVLDKVLARVGNVPVIGSALGGTARLAGGAVRMASEAQQRGANAQAALEALNSPIANPTVQPGGAVSLAELSKKPRLNGAVPLSALGQSQNK